MMAESQFCTNCGAEISVQANFCPNCGKKTDGSAIPVDAQSAEGERRQITVMFCDLVDSTALSSRLDPEDLRETLRQYHAHAQSAVEAFGGVVAQYLGDGVLVYFGARRAHEDDAERAIRAGMQILEGIPRINDRLSRSIVSLVEDPIRVRVGVHTGPVVVDGAQVGERRDSLAWGETVNVAARLESLAPPGSCVISDATRKLVEGLFELEPLGRQMLKGIERPMEVYRLVSSIGPRRRRSLPGGYVPKLIGRQEEYDRLLALWEAVSDGQGRALRVTGEPGIGKTRLVEDLKDQLTAPHDWIEIHCSAYYSSSPFFPVIEALRHALEFKPADTGAAQLDMLNRAIERAAIEDPEARSLLASLLSIPLPPQSPTATGDSELLRKKTMQMLCAGLRARSLKRPVVLLVEDVHWVDASTLELVEMLVEGIADRRILVIVTHRTSFVPGWPGWAELPELALKPLNVEDSADIVRGVIGERGIPERVLSDIVSRSDGVPLFAEEFARSVVEAEEHSAGADAAVEIPSTLQDSLTARLDRLGDARGVAQLAAVLGRRFRLDLLVALSPFGENALMRSLEELNAAQLLLPVDTDGHQTLVFKHALIQNAAYESLLKRRRLELHAQVVHVLEEHFPERLEETPEVVARHCEAGGLPLEALGYWQRAAQRARQRMALTEEINHLRRAITLLLEHVPEGRERDEQELALRLALTEQLLSSSGMASTEAEQMTARATELCVKLDSHDKLFMVLLGRAIVDLGRGRNRSVLQLSQELIQIASGLGIPHLRAQIAMPLGGALGMTGKPREALDELESGADAIEVAGRQGLDAVMVDGIRTMCRSWAADNLWLLGFPDRALGVANHTLEAVQGPDVSPPVRAQGWVSASIIAVLRGDIEAAAEYAPQLISFSEQQNLPFGVAHGTICLGWANARRGETEQGIREMQEGLDALEQVGTSMKRSIYLTLLAEAGLSEGSLETCELALQDGFAHAEEYEEVFFLAELLRLRGELELASRHRDAAADCYEQALDTAARQGARMLELRAATSWTRLVGARGRTILEPLYDSFREGAETRDLIQARRLLGRT